MWTKLTILCGLVLFVLPPKIQNQNVEDLYIKLSDEKTTKLRQSPVNTPEDAHSNGRLIRSKDVSTLHKTRHHHGEPKSSNNHKRSASNPAYAKILINRCPRYYNGQYYYTRCPWYCPCASYGCPRCIPYNPYSTRQPLISCNCHPEGSMFNTCDSHGACRCKPNFEGPKCRVCKAGYWKNGNQGCISCDCHPDGSKTIQCSSETGDCSCKSGVGGTKCNACLPNHYGSIQTQCRECDPCDKEGHICDPTNGKCVCPPYTRGPKCDACIDNAYGYLPGIGCKNCECSPTGCLKPQCNKQLGDCLCKIGYEGQKCDRCSLGYYGYPQCKKCSCNIEGTLQEEFFDGISRCLPDGSCRCKKNVEGKHCDNCKLNTFGLDQSNPEGCTKCFCFGRSNRCTLSESIWDQISTDEINPSYNDCVIYSPCIKLPKVFTGDLTTSYGGYLRILPLTENSRGFAYITGNNVTIQAEFGNEVKLLENHWNVHRTSNKLLPECNSRLSRECFMVIIQNVAYIEVTIFQEQVKEILLDRATSVSASQQVTTIEKCQCPPEYQSLSCQNPNLGYYRVIPDLEDYKFTWIDRIVGVAEKCRCSGRSDVCDVETGYCKDCKEFTSGRFCELCAEGYYRGLENDCLPCLCPTEELNFAQNCSINKFNQFLCNCKLGYTGKKCDKCDSGYFGNPDRIDGFCEECKCHPSGSSNYACDKSTGQCTCLSGFTGQKCDKCKSQRKFIQNGICVPCDECTQILFEIIDNLSSNLHDFYPFKDKVPLPWKYLEGLENNFIDIRNRFSHYNDTVEVFLKNFDEISKDEDRTNNLFIQSKNKRKIVDDISNDEEKMKNLVDDFKQNLFDSEMDIYDFIKSMDNFTKQPTDIKTALDIAKNTLRYLDNMKKYINDPIKFEDIFNRCNSIYEKTKNIFQNYESDTDSPQKINNDLLERLKNITDEVHVVKKNKKLANAKNKENFQKLHYLKSLIKNATVDAEKITTSLSKSKNYRDQTKTYIKNIEKLLKKLKDGVDHTDLSIFEDRLDRVDKDITDIEDVINSLRNHADKLNNTVNMLKRIVNFTPAQDQKIHALQSYNVIIKTVNESEDIARKALEDIEKLGSTTFHPYPEDPLIDKASISVTISDREVARIKNHINKSDLRKKINENQYEVNKLEKSIYQNGKDNNRFNAILHNSEQKMSSNKREKVQKNIDSSLRISKNMTNIIKEVTGMEYEGEHAINRKFKKFNLTAWQDIDEINRNISSNWRNMMNLKLNNSFKDIIDKKREEIGLSSASLNEIKEKIKALNARIKQTSDLASNMNLPLSIVNCSRQYQIKQNGVIDSIKITFSCTNCDLFEFQKDNILISMKVEDQKLLFKWNKKSINLPLMNSNVTTIIVERKQNEIVLSTGFQSKSIFDPNLVFLQETDVFTLGKFSTFSPTKENTGCIYGISFNGISIGLWNFKTSIGRCKPCLMRTTDVKKAYTFYDQNGYAVYQNYQEKPSQISITFTFTTFDENSLIFLAQETANPCAYMAVNIKNGYLDFNIQHNDLTKASLSIPNFKVNTGEETKVTLTLSFQKPQQKYIFSSSFVSNNTTNFLDNSHVFKIKQSRIFIGGVSPTFDGDCIPVNTTSFVGFLDYSRLGAATLAMSSKVTAKQSPDLNFKRAWFLEKSFMEVNTTAFFKRKNFTFSFELSTNLQDAFLMTINKIGNLSISNRRLVLKLINGESIQCDTPLNNVLSRVNISVNDERTSLVVDDEEKIGSKVKLRKGEWITLIIGEDSRSDLPNFIGGITNLNVDNKLLTFNQTTIANFVNVEVGRWHNLAPSNFATPTYQVVANNVDNMQNTQRCSPAVNHQSDPDAIKFGDKFPSYILRKLTSWKKNYTLELSFRTGYPYGSLIISKGNQLRQHYIVLEIKNSKLQVTFKAKRKPTTLSFEQPVDDGKWHTIKMEHQGVKKKRKLLFTLDDAKKKPVRIPKPNVLSETFIGGAPTNFSNEFVVQQFKGCIRSFKINEVPQLNVKNFINHINLGSCFASVEKGAYFGGDGYVIYKNDFKIEKLLELNFEFKTADHNGILVSVSNQNNSPALSVELQGGAVVMTVVTVDAMDKRIVSSVTNNLDSDYTLCNNKWHNVTALYSSTELTVIVDGIRKSWVQSDDESSIDEIEAPLYIGGLPDFAPTGTLKIKQNFKGCIKNLKVGENLMDWSDMNELNNIALDSCPVDE